MTTKKWEIKLEAEADDKYSFSEALDRVSGQIADGYTSGDLRNESISFGVWSIDEVEPVPLIPLDQQ